MSKEMGDSKLMISTGLGSAQLHLCLTEGLWRKQSIWLHSHCISQFQIISL